MVVYIFQWESQSPLAFMKWPPPFFCTFLFPLLVYKVRFIPLHHHSSLWWWLRYVPNSALLLGTSELLLGVSALKLSICLMFEGKGPWWKTTKVRRKIPSWLTVFTVSWGCWLSVQRMTLCCRGRLSARLTSLSAQAQSRPAGVVCFPGKEQREPHHFSFALLTEFHQLLLNNALYTLFLHFLIYIHTFNLHISRSI